MTPTVLRSGPYRFFFYSDEGFEPPHVHVRRDDREAKFWLDPVALAANHGFATQELNRLEAIVVKNHEPLREAWIGYFTS